MGGGDNTTLRRGMAVMSDSDEAGGLDIHDVLQRVRERCRTHRDLTPDELERLADMLLRVCGPAPEYPIRDSLEHRSVEVHSLDDPSDSIGAQARRRPASPDTTGPSLQALIAHLLVAAHLVSRRQRTVARLHLWGYSLVEIAELLGLPYSTVASRWRTARTRLKRAVEELATEGWPARPSRIDAISAEQVADTFRDEQDRCPYEPPRHCPRGKERCRVTGICVRRGQAAGRVRVEKEER